MFSKLLLFSLFFLSLSAFTYQDRNQIYEGVTDLIFGGAWGPVYYSDPTKSFTILLDNSVPYIAATEYGLGRAIAVGKDNALDYNQLASASDCLFMANIFKWLAKGKTTLKVLSFQNAIRSTYADLLNTRGLNITLTQISKLPQSYTDVDIVVIGYIGTFPTSVNDSQIEQLQGFVENGGALLSAGMAWVWWAYGEGTQPNKNLYTDFFNNRVLGKMGLYHVDGPYGIKEVHNIQPLDPATDENKVNIAVQLLAQRMNANQSLSTGEQTQIQEAINLIQSNQWLSFNNIFPSSFNYDYFLECYRVSKYLPNPKSQLPVSDTTGNLIYSLFLAIDKMIPRFQARTPLPDAAFWPGIAISSERTTVSVMFPQGRKKFICTGVFENAGEVISVSLSNANLLKLGVTVRIGTGDDLRGKSVTGKRIRFPLVTNEFKMTEQSIRVSTMHGGMVYIFLDNPTNDTSAFFTVSGAVPAPYFNSELHTDLDWIKVRNMGSAPFFNLECKGLIFIYQVTPFIKNTLQNVTTLCQWWDKVYSNYPYLSGDIRPYKEVIMGDIDISAGYMHSGMPVMTFLDVVDFSLGQNNEIFQKCSWGHFHELGHNYQRGDWTFDGTGEVTNNIWSLYGGLTMCGFQPLSNPWFGTGWINKTVTNYFAGNSNFTIWKSQPGLALVMYAQIAEEFGFDAFKRTFAVYWNLSAAERPQNDDQKRDQWMTRLSKEVGMNLDPFFTKWGIPISDTARATVADLPVWIPKEFISGFK